MDAGKNELLTKRTSPRSNHGFVVNHSHMNALVEPSFTDVTRLWMSLLTGSRSALSLV